MKMKNNSIYIIITILTSCFSIIPLWDFNNTVTDLLTSSNSYSYSIILYEKTYHSKKFTITKIFSRDGNSTTEKNILQIEEEYQKETEWEEIESFYYFNDAIYLCPRGKNYLNKYDQNNKKFDVIKPAGFTDPNNWELKCYHQTDSNYFFMTFTNNHNYICYSKDTYFTSWTWGDGDTKIHQGLCDFKWTTQYITTSQNDGKSYLMTAITIRDNSIILHGSRFLIKGNTEDVKRDDSSNQGYHKIIENLSDSYAYFSEDNYSFIFFSYNDTHFKSGYYENSGTFQNSDINNLIITKINEESPLDFFYDFKIKKIHYIRNTNYIYYEIYNDIIDKKYYGFIDIKLNKVIFNTDEEILSHSKISSNTLLIRTKQSAYSICIILNANQCIDNCPNNDLKINSLGSNFCGSNCSSNFIMKPNDICINECDENLFYKNGNECGLCKDLNSAQKYKLINTSGCLENIPEGAEFYIQKNNILKCKDEYYSFNNYCVLKSETSIPLIETTVPLPNIKCEDNEVILKYNNPKNNNEFLYRCVNIYENGIYYDSEENYYKLCYEACLTCNKAGNKIKNNCLKCGNNYRESPVNNLNSNEFNCVVKCPYFYINTYNQYKCVESLPCPNEAKYIIKEKGQCTFDCKRDNKYKYAYNGNCLEKCPNQTTADDNKICKDVINGEFILITNDIELNYTSFVRDIDTFVERYSEEFSYTDNHATQYKNEEYTAVIYKDSNCIDKLSLDFPKFEFGDCYEEVKKVNNITQDLIIVVINKNDDDNNPETYYSLYHPITGAKLETEEICKDYKVSVVENISTLIKNLSNYNTLMTLINQEINIFNSSDKFYTDICFDYNINTNKDIALQDRLKLFYPNITLCDSGCNQTNVNLKEMTANCQCEFNDISSNQDKSGKNNLKDNALIENLMGNVFNFIDSSNIGVGKCLKKSSKAILKHYGFYISLFIIIITSIMIIIYFLFDIKKIQIYISNNSSNYLNYISSPENIKNTPPLRNLKSKGKKKKTLKKIKKDKKVNINFNRIKNLNIMNSVKNNDFGKDSKISLLKLEKNSAHNIFETNNYKSILNELKYKKYKKYFDSYLSKSLDEMEFDDAIIEDHRKYLEYLKDCLKEKQIILNTFWAYEPLKPKSIKIILFSLTIFLHFVINALFINDSYVSEVYNLKKEDNFFSFVPRSINRFFYATLVGIVIEFIVDFFFVQEKKMKGIFIREKENIFNIKKEIVLLLNLIKIKFIFFIIFVYIILVSCLYYLLCFNSIYPNMQIEWIKSSIFIIFIRQILSVIQCILETSLRIISFRYESEKVFKISKLIN